MSSATFLHPCLAFGPIIWHNPSMRLFAAIPLPAADQHRIAEYCRTIAPLFVSARPSWVPEENLHLTLHFFGELDPRVAATLQNLLEAEAANCPPLTLRIGNLSVLPSVRAPRVLYLHTHIEPAPPLFSLIDRLRIIASEIGAETDSRPWKAHLTLARLKEPWIPELSSLPAVPDISFTSNAFELMQSRLTRGGAMYSCVRRYTFLASSR